MATKKSKAEERAEAHGWVKVERGRIRKWEKNMVAEGIFRGLQEGRGKFKTPLLKIEEEDGIATYSCPTILQSYLEGVNVGISIKIVCLGKTKASSRGHQDPWDFDVYYLPAES